MGRKKTGAKVRGRFHRVETGPSAPHALRRDEDGKLIGQNEEHAAVKLIFTFITVMGVSIAALAEDRITGRTADHDYDPPPPGSYALPVIKRAADGPLLDWNSQPVQLRDLTRGRVTVLSFIYTRCAANRACPYATGVLLELHE